jgi:hypothetical protein
MAFYLGGKLAASGQIAHIYDKSAYQPLIEQLRSEGERMSPFDAHYFIRPAFEAFLYVPFTWFSYRRAATLALIGNLGLLVVLVWKLPIWLGVPTPLRAPVRAALSVFYPFLWSIVVGQDTLLLTLVISYTLSRQLRGKDAIAGAVLGLCSWKPNLTWLLPFALVAQRCRMAMYDIAVSLFVLGASIRLVGAAGFRQWVDLVQAPSSDITPLLMGNLRALGLQFGGQFVVIALLLTAICLYVVLRRGSLGDKVSASLLAGLLISPHTYWQDYSLAAIVAMVKGTPTALLVFLLPWPYFYDREDELPMIWISLSYLVVLGVKQAFKGRPNLGEKKGRGVACNAGFTSSLPDG